MSGNVLRFDRRRRMRPGALLADWRAAIAEAVRLERKRQPGAAAHYLDERRGKILDELIRRRGVTLVLKHAHTIAAILRRVQQAEVADAYSARSIGE